MTSGLPTVNSTSSISPSATNVPSAVGHSVQQDQQQSDIFVAPFPRLGIRKKIASDIWSAALQEWCALTEYYVSRPETIPPVAIVQFLKSYVSLSRDEDETERSNYRSRQDRTAKDEPSNDPMERQLRRNVFILLSRFYHSQPASNLDMIWGFYRLYSRLNQSIMIEILRDYQIKVVPKLVALVLDRLNAGILSLEEIYALQVLFTDKGLARAWVTVKPWISELSEHLKSAARNDGVKNAATSDNVEQNPSSSELILRCAYLSLVSTANLIPETTVECLKYLLTNLPRPHQVTVGDLLPALVVSTNFIPKLRSTVASLESSGSVNQEDDNIRILNGILVSFDTIRLKIPREVVSEIERTFKRPNKQTKPAKGKQLSNNSIGSESIKNVRDIFPHLSADEVIRALKLNDNNPERAIIYLVDHDIVAPQEEPQETSEPSGPDISISVPVPDRFVDLTKELSKISIGKSSSVTADEMLTHVPREADKKKIIDSLRLMYDEDDDERDDTYDDVDASTLGLDSTLDEAASLVSQEDPNERILWHLYNTKKSAFTTNDRKSRQRVDLKSMTGWTDEQIEGWARMIDRDARLRRRLETTYEFKGNHPPAVPDIAAAESRNRGEDENEQERSSTTNFQHGGRHPPEGSSGRGRGNDGRGRGRGSKTSGRVNHGRKEGHARKMRRGMSDI
ncbi:hypothetical protein V1511DRAFT_8562 [Dipodascopsis uninucleata]